MEQMIKDLVNYSEEDRDGGDLSLASPPQPSAPSADSEQATQKRGSRRKQANPKRKAGCETIVVGEDGASSSSSSSSSANQEVVAVVLGLYIFLSLLYILCFNINYD